MKEKKDGADKHEGCKRQFIHLGRAWYGAANLKGGEVLDEVFMGFYDAEGGTTGEFSVRWTMLGRKPTAELRAFDDAWSALWAFGDVLARLAELDGTNPTPAAVCAVLGECGVEDVTPTECPYAKAGK